MAHVLSIAPGITQIDTLMAGMDQVSAGFVVAGDDVALIETGPATSAATVRDHLAQAGVPPEALRWLIVTHIHLDHAGGVGDLAAAFPEATVVVHPKGARHLVDPSRLMASAAQVYGDALDTMYGQLRPTEAERVRAVEDGEIIDLGGGRRIEVLHTPGHAKHHMALLEPDTGALFVGDAVGVYLPDAPVLRPTTPPPDFDLAQTVASLRRLAGIDPSLLVLSHFGVVASPLEFLAGAEEEISRWCEIAGRALEQGAGIEGVDAALRSHADEQEKDLSPEARAKLEAFNSVHFNAVGLSRYHELRRATEAE
ncbi:MAG: MBL fold metallo-hydrolase [Actinomycetota bacterium]